MTTLLVVRDMESADAPIVGTYAGTEEDTVAYVVANGELRQAPYDCVRIERVEFAPGNRVRVNDQTEVAERVGRTGVIERVLAHGEHGHDTGYVFVRLDGDPKVYGLLPSSIERV